TTMSKQAIASEQVREGLKDVLPGPAQLYEALREKAGEKAVEGAWQSWICFNSRSSRCSLTASRLPLTPQDLLRLRLAQEGDLNAKEAPHNFAPLCPMGV